MNRDALLQIARKECRHLIPLLSALLALEFVALLDSLFSQSPDELAWSEFSMLLNSGYHFFSELLFVIGVIAGYNVFAGEKNQRTLSFLMGLPISRQRLFAVKLLTAFGVLAMYLFCSQLLSWGLQNFAASSIGQAQFSWSLWWLELVLIIGIVTIGLAYGALLSHFRMPGILGLVLLWLLVNTLVYLRPDLDYLVIRALIIPEFQGNVLVISGRAWLFHGVLALLAVGIALLLWTRRTDPRADLRQTPGRGSRIISGLVYIVAFVIIVNFFARALLPTGLLDQQSDNASRIVTLDTEQFQFAFFSEDDAPVSVLVSEADALAGPVKALLDTDIDEPLLIDMTDDSQDHLGIAGWKRLRINRTSLLDRAERHHVFVHELTHVLADKAAEGRLTDHAGYTGFFNEGLGEWVTYRTLSMDQERDALMQLAAMAWQRLSLRFDDFLYTAPFVARFDQGLVYAVGLAWHEALARECGAGAAALALRAMARPDMSQRLAGAGFWRDVLQSFQCDLVAVNNRFDAMMQALAPATEAVPEVIAEPTLLGDSVVFNLRLAETDNPENYRVYVRLRDNPQVSPSGVVTRTSILAPGTPRQISMPASVIAGQTYQYQVGIEFSEYGRPYYSRWIDSGI